MGAPRKKLDASVYDSQSLAGVTEFCAWLLAMWEREDPHFKRFPFERDGHRRARLRLLQYAKQLRAGV